MANDILRNLELYFPNDFDRMIEYFKTGPFEITIQRDDGSWILYDDLDHSIRRLPNGCGDMSESDIRKEFGIRLKKMMWIRGMDQKDLAEATGLTQPQISNYISGQTAPSFPKVDRIAKALRCSVDAFRFYDYDVNDRK